MLGASVRQQISAFWMVGWRVYEWIAMWAGYAALLLLCVLWFPFALVLGVVLSARQGQYFGRQMIGIGFRLYAGFLQWFCACRFDLSDLEHLPASEPQIFVANHPSLLDAPLILSRLPNTACVMKAGLMDNILLGAAARLAGYIRNDAPLNMLLAMREALVSGSVLIFPEGTRTTHVPVNLFGNAALLVARQTGVPIQTLLVSFDYAYLGKNWPLWRPPNLPLRVKITLGERFVISGRQGVSAAELRAYFSEALSQESVHHE